MSDEDATSEGWIVYMAFDGGIMLSGPADGITSWDRDAAGVHREPHVIGRGPTEDEARADARRGLTRR